MAFLALLIGVVLLVSALRDTHGELFGALETDVPGFAVWGAAIFGVAAIGFIPGLKPVSRGLLALILTVIFVTNYKAILAGFTGLATTDPQQANGVGGGTSATDAAGAKPDAGSLFISPSGTAPITGDEGSTLPGMVVNGIAAAGGAG